MKEVIILAGGLGTRLQSAVQDKPKALAPIQKHAFLAYLLAYLETQWVDHVILALGHEHLQVLDWLNDQALTFKLNTTIEHEPLGTGGAIKRALGKSKQDEVIIMNGDTFFPINLEEFRQASQDANVPIHIALSKVEDTSRYGKVIFNEDQIIEQFQEKGAQEDGNENWINGGIYYFKKSLLSLEDLPEAFSWEKEVLEELVPQKGLKGIPFQDAFIDIGVPEDYEKAQTLIPELFSQLGK